MCSSFETDFSPFSRSAGPRASSGSHEPNTPIMWQVTAGTRSRQGGRRLKSLLAHWYWGIRAGPGRGRGGKKSFAAGPVSGTERARGNGGRAGPRQDAGKCFEKFSAIRDGAGLPAASARPPPGRAGCRGARAIPQPAPCRHGAVSRGAWPSCRFSRPAGQPPAGRPHILRREEAGPAAGPEPGTLALGVGAGVVQPEAAALRQGKVPAQMGQHLGAADARTSPGPRRRHSAAGRRGPRPGPPVPASGRCGGPGGASGASSSMSSTSKGPAQGGAGMACSCHQLKEWPVAASTSRARTMRWRSLGWMRAA